MEDLLKNDSTFELFTNSSDSKMLNKTLMSYPSEKSSFDVFLGVNGDNNRSDYSYFETSEELKKQEEEEQRRKDERQQQLADVISSTSAAITSTAAVVEAFRSDGTKTQSRRKQLKELCGRKPLLKKNREKYDKCVDAVNQAILEGLTTNQRSGGWDAPPPPPPTESPNNTTRNIIIGVVVLGVLATAFIGYKKGWFNKKAA